MYTMYNNIIINNVHTEEYTNICGVDVFSISLCVLHNTFIISIDENPRDQRYCNCSCSNLSGGGVWISYFINTHAVLYI
jgi:hypothetical protein